MMPDEDLRDTYIKSVLNDVGTVLSGKDLMLLQNTWVRRQPRHRFL